MTTFFFSTQFQLVLSDNEDHLPKVPNGSNNPEPGGGGGAVASSKRTFDVRVTSGVDGSKSSQKSWHVRRTLEDFRFLDRQLHLCVYDRRFSNLAEIPDQENVSNANGITDQVRHQDLHIPASHRSPLVFGLFWDGFQSTLLFSYRLKCNY